MPFILSSVKCLENGIKSRIQIIIVIYHIPLDKLKASEKTKGHTNIEYYIALRAYNQKQYNK